MKHNLSKFMQVKLVVFLFFREDHVGDMLLLIRNFPRKWRRAAVSGSIVYAVDES